MRPRTVADVERAIFAAFPSEWAEEWDKVGLLAGDPDREVTGVVFALDPTRPAISHCERVGANVLVTHHPAFLNPPALVRPGRGAGGVVFAALDSGIALVNAHTNLDRSPAASSLLANSLGLASVRPIERRTMPMTHVVAFVPPKSADRVVDAMLGAGAGRIGDYSGCAFTSSEGVGTFTPGEDSHPAVGDTRRAESSSEVRVEVVAPRSRARGVVSAARAAHPYEEPLIVATEVEIARSVARMGTLCQPAQPLTLADLATIAAEAFEVTPRVWGDPTTPLTHIATATGSAGSLIGDVLASGAQALVAGEVRYHDALDALESGLSIIELGHDVSEWPLVSLLHRAVAGIEGIDPESLHVMESRPGWWTPQQGRPE